MTSLAGALVSSAHKTRCPLLPPARRPRPSSSRRLAFPAFARSVTRSPKFVHGLRSVAASPTAAPTTVPSLALAGCFTDVDGGATIRQTIGKTAAMLAQTGSVPTKQQMETCGWRFAPGTELLNYCPGDPYGGNHTGLRPMGDYSKECMIASPSPGATPPDPMVMVYESGSPRGVVNYTLPSSTEYCSFRIKFYEQSTCETCSSNPATMKLAGLTVWASSDNLTTTCATVVSGAFEPGDVITFTERAILALFWLELVPDGSLGCGTATATATECCGDCSITRAPTTAEGDTIPVTTGDPGLLDDRVRSSGSDGDRNDGWIVVLIAVLVLGCVGVTGVALRRKLTTHVPVGSGSNGPVVGQDSAVAVSPDQDPASFGLANLAHDMDAANAPTPDSDLGDYDLVEVPTEDRTALAARGGAFAARSTYQALDGPVYAGGGEPFATASPGQYDHLEEQRRQADSDVDALHEVARNDPAAARATYQALDGGAVYGGGGQPFATASPGQYDHLDECQAGSNGAAVYQVVDNDSAMAASAMYEAGVGPTGTKNTPRPRT